MKGGAFEWDKNGFRTERYTLKPLNNWQSTIWIRMAGLMVKESTEYGEAKCVRWAKLPRAPTSDKSATASAAMCEWVLGYNRLQRTAGYVHTSRKNASLLYQRILLCHAKPDSYNSSHKLIYLIHPGSRPFQLTVTHKTSFFQLFLYPEFGLNFTLFY